jgi:endonuclease VIII
MPEGDTVLRTARRLHQALAGRQLVRAELRWPTLGEADLAGRLVTEVVSYGKHILTRFAAADATTTQPKVPTVGANPLTLRSHLRMEGRWYVHARDAEPWPSRERVSVRAVLGGTEWTAIGTWLGLLDLVPTIAEHSLIGHLGPDIMADGFDPTWVGEAVNRLAADPQRHVGAALLDQTAVAGIGTMYMAESLFVQKTSPWTPISEVDLPALLATARRQLLRGATQAIPTTSGNPQRGLQTWVHGRSGRPCQRCGMTVRVAPIGPPLKERPAFYCPKCQPGPTPTDDGKPRSPLGANPAIRQDRRPTGYRRS